ncbi:MAG: superoxide dismutase [Ni] [Myxococcota bacterium]|nr:superoxide dismutase [Ni] [Myxococcota bacterium]
MRTTLNWILFLSLLGFGSAANAHCQVPCGIYDDHARIHAMLEDTKTIAKAVTKLKASETKTDAQNLNQRVRWTNTKEAHASHIIEVISTYFLTQKIKPADPKDKAGYNAYINKLTACHRIMRHAMKAKQTVDSGVADKLKEAIDHLGTLYPKK